MADLLDVARFEVDLDRKPILELVEARRVDRGDGVVVGERLLGGGEDPGVPLADLPEVLRQPVQIEDEAVLGGYVLPHLVDDEENRLLA